MAHVILISRRHLPTLRVRVEQRGRRLARMARNMARAGFTAWRIRRATGLHAGRVEAILADSGGGLWSPAEIAAMREEAR